MEASEADVQASQEDLRNVLVTMLAEVALNYVEVRSFQARLDVAQQNLDAQQETYTFIQSRFQAGLVNELDVEQAKTNLESTQAAVPSLRTSLAQVKNRLSVLLGQTPGAVDTALEDRKPIPVTPIETAVGVPANVLRRRPGVRRPDVRRAERQLAAETARIGVATAELYPKLSLSGSIGLESTSLASLFTGGSQVFGIGPSFTWNLFNAGQVRQEIAIQTAIQEEALLSYETAVLEALEEVENAITAYTNEQVRWQSLLKAAAAADRSVKLAENRYRSGLTDFLVVLDAQRSLLTLQDQLTVSECEITSNLIRLYKALGGGWTALDPQIATDRA